MPTRKHPSEKKEALVPTKEEATGKPLKVTLTGQTDKPRINALATSGKKKKPK
ncbi:hypothetical protein [Candidatus Protochlamydia phocaeensis]|uniref:hypothetical protein n=1 Tax=Candidatus Protochlamydia phocaeensis TaxID=1414722 RepID=UPI000B080193|nr:hypothetical protein [Candidatus Protochlamydia phocaeensis]